MFKHRIVWISLVSVGCLIGAASGFGHGPELSPLIQGGQETAGRPRQVKPTPTPTPKATTGTSTSPTAGKQVPAADLIAQGKTHYRAGRYKQALTRFEAALKAEPDHDEALGLAAVTAFRLDNQEQARAWFLRRAEMSGQKPSVKAFSYYRVALTYWRETHDVIAMAGSITKGMVEYKLPDAERTPVLEKIRTGLDYADRALAINANYAEALNVKNLLQTEAAFAESDATQGERLRKAAAASLRQAISLQRSAPVVTEAESANFNLPTVRIGEIPRTTDEEKTFVDDMLMLLEGGRPIKRVSPVFPSTRPSKSSIDDTATGVTDKGGAYSIGGGRGALTAAYAPGIVKLEVLISSKGDVVFAHVVDGRDDLNGAAILAARGWKFSPPRFESAPVQISGLITFEMKPPGSRAAPTPRPSKP